MKKYIKSYEDLVNSLRVTGHLFPFTPQELQNAAKLYIDIDYTLLSEKVVAEEIWEADAPRTKTIELLAIDKQDLKISSSWAIAARGNPNLSKATLDKIRKNQQKGGGSDQS